MGFLEEAQRYWDQREYQLALDYFIRGQHFSSDSLGVATNVADLLMTLRRAPEAMAILEAASSLDPSYAPLRANLLTNGLYRHGQNARKVAKRHFDWGKSFSGPPQPAVPPASGTLRIGYLSANFNVNPEAFFALPLIQQHDRSKVEVFCYSSGASGVWTADFRNAADHWRDISEAPDEDAIRRIRKDRLHILADLSGHFANGRLRLLAQQPAPIQVSFPTYPATTGLKTVQYRITDRHADPVGMTESLHTERLLRLSGCFYCYVPPKEAPPVDVLPANRNGYVTYGVFNRPQKITDRMLRLWARVLSATQESRILFHHAYNGPRPVQMEFREPIYRVFQDEGIPRTRIEFIGMRSPVGAHLDLFNEVDISLDTYPYHGLTTTCESLWMGVPVVTLGGNSHVARTSVSLNACVGLSDWTARSESEYARIAIRAARNLEDLGELRSTLRKRMAASGLTNAKVYAAKLERAYERMWKRAKPGA